MRNLPTIRRATGVVAAAVAALAFAAGCSDDSHNGGHDAGAASPTASSTSVQPGVEHNQADIAFAQGMIPHHQQAVEMADLAETRAGAGVKALAAKIKQAQAPE